MIPKRPDSDRKHSVAPFGFDMADITLILTKTLRFCKMTYCARILIASARFPPFVFDIPEISCASNENIAFSLTLFPSLIPRRSFLFPFPFSRPSGMRGAFEYLFKVILIILLTRLQTNKGVSHMATYKRQNLRIVALAVFWPTRSEGDAN